MSSISSIKPAKACADKTRSPKFLRISVSAALGHRQTIRIPLSFTSGESCKFKKSFLMKNIYV